MRKNITKNRSLRSFYREDAVINELYKNTKNNTLRFIGFKRNDNIYTVEQFIKSFN